MMQNNKALFLALCVLTLGTTIFAEEPSPRNRYRKMYREAQQEAKNIAADLPKLKAMSSDERQQCQNLYAASQKLYSYLYRCLDAEDSKEKAIPACEDPAIYLLLSIVRELASREETPQDRYRRLYAKAQQEAKHIVAELPKADLTNLSHETVCEQMAIIYQTGELIEDLISRCVNAKDEEILACEDPAMYLLFNLAEELSRRHAISE